MPGPRPVVVDTNILFSALLRQPTRFADVLLRTDQRCFICEQVLVELFKHKEKIIKASRLPEDDILRWYHILLRRLTVYKEDLIAPEHRAAAYALCQNIDPSDTPHVALTLHLHGLLWTGDTTLKDGLRAKGFTDFFEP